jgi:hypothetical protein
MQRAQNIIKSIYFGFDIQNLYFRFDPIKPINYESAGNLTFKLAFIRPSGYEVRIHLTKDRKVDLQLLTKNGTTHNNHVVLLDPGAAGKIIEFAVPLTVLKMPPEDKHIEWVVIVENVDTEIERWPAGATFSIPYPSQDVFAESWVI